MTYTIGKKSLSTLNDNSEKSFSAAIGLSGIDPNSSLAGMLRASNIELADAYDSIDANYKAGYVRTSSGPYLDGLALDANLQREVFFETIIPCSSRMVELRTNNGSTLWSALNNPVGNFIILPRGMKVYSSSDQRWVFSIDETVTINRTDKSVYLGLSARLDDSVIIPAGTIDTIDLASYSPTSSANLSVIKVIQHSDIIGIERVESDESLRLRISRWSTANLAGNTDAILNQITSHPDIAKVVPQKNVRGTGSAVFIVFPVKNRISQQLIETLNARISYPTSFGEDIRVTAPDYVPVSIELTASAVNNKNAIVTTVEEYFEDLDNKQISYNLISQFMRQRGYNVFIKRITVEGRNILPSASVSILDNEMFVLEPRISSERSVEVVLQ